MISSEGSLQAGLHLCHKASNNRYAFVKQKAPWRSKKDLTEMKDSVSSLSYQQASWKYDFLFPA